jgi:hypothetical protein
VEVALSWTALREPGDRQDVVTLYPAPFRDIVGATVRHRRKGAVDVWIEDGPTLSFRVTPEAADAPSARRSRGTSAVVGGAAHDKSARPDRPQQPRPTVPVSVVAI